MTTDLAALVLLAAVTYGTRAGGVYLAGQITNGGRTSKLLTALSGCVLAALVGPAMVHGDAGLRVGVLAALLAYLIWRRPLVAIGAAVAATAALRSVL